MPETVDGSAEPPGRLAGAEAGDARRPAPEAISGVLRGRAVLSVEQPGRLDGGLQAVEDVADALGARADQVGLTLWQQVGRPDLGGHQLVRGVLAVKLAPVLGAVEPKCGAHGSTTHNATTTAQHGRAIRLANSKPRRRSASARSTSSFTSHPRWWQASAPTRAAGRRPESTDAAGSDDQDGSGPAPSPSDGRR